jgi:predicted metalloprotease
MSSLIRPPLLAVAALLLVLGGASLYLATAKAADATDSDTVTTDTKHKPTKRQVREASKQAQKTAGSLTASPSASAAHDLILGSKDSAQPENMEQFLTAVTKDVDTYWTKAFKDSGLPEPRVSYKWIPAGQTAASACGDANGAMGDSAAAYCSGDDTIYVSEKFATDIYNGALDQALPGSSQGYGRTVGDFAVAYIVAHEYGHQVQDELGLFQKYGQQLPTMAFELQADCYAGTWAKSAYKENRLEDGDVQEALDAALAVGDFDASNPAHHGTPEQREGAWNSGFEAGDPSSCSRYLDPANLGDAGGTPQQDPGAGDTPQQDPGTGSPQQEDPGAGYPQEEDPGAGYPQEQDPGAGYPQQQDPGAGYPQQQDPGYPSDGTGYGYEPYGVAAGRG